MLDPDQSVRDAVAHLFATFATHRLGARRGQGVRRRSPEVPLRASRPGRTKAPWLGCPSYTIALLQVLHNPRYAGAFVYGRRRQRRGPDGRTRHALQPREAWTVLIPDAHPGYISWDRYEDNLRRLAECAQSRGEDRRVSPPREGPALLQGLAVCARCGKRMTVRYHARGQVLLPEYLCQRAGIEARHRALRPCRR